MAGPEPAQALYNINDQFVTVADGLDEAIDEFLSWAGPVYLSSWPELEFAETAAEVVRIMGLRVTHEVAPRMRAQSASN